ncbi:hypothetical protein HD_0799 [[Haemophilus] ducreyi 35000HP]|uniref:Uncharacterized protein n=1 Tax=Haemophilus ducreyi (strain 35000HP / ATCC 700724) TaxID=233412 RepID=Q7VN02_HAEDU|nr:hypothetical protein HD_0799 [[Haemophilus] ducreyi 35000HP]SEV79356.1 hypothetical protein SAMN02983000_0174 [[Haemophilus] ducreyi]VEG82515.1 Uncharacterised protein [[Haemophilus] ducreyi]
MRNRRIKFKPKTHRNNKNHRLLHIIKRRQAIAKRRNAAFILLQNN